MPIKEVTSEEAIRIIDTREPRGLFYTRENRKIVGIDNSTGDAWTEDFENLFDCVEWLDGKEVYRLI